MLAMNVIVFKDEMEKPAPLIGSGLVTAREIILLYYKYARGGLLGGGGCILYVCVLPF